MSDTPRTNILAEITAEDIKDPKAFAFKLNMVFRVLGDQLLRTQGYAGPFRFGESQLSFNGQASFAKSVEVGGPVNVTGTSDRSGNRKVFQAVQGLSVYSDNAAALAGGLAPGDFYRTATGQLMVVY